MTIVLHKKGDTKDTKNITLPHVHIVHVDITKQIEKVLDESQTREQAGFRKGYSTVDHLQAINQLIVKCN